jgi:Na+/phosphate symporter
MLFNVLGVLAFVAFVPFLEKTLNRLLPDTAQEKQKLQEAAQPV